VTHWTRHTSRLDREFGRECWGSLAAEAEQRLAGTGWLPAILRRPVVAAAEAKPELETLAAE
jgi:hypothetical protein